MRHLRFQLLWSIFFSLIFYTCQPVSSSKEPTKKKVFARYYVKYSQNDQTYKAEASFLTGDSTVNALATEMESVSFQGGIMKQRTQPRNDLSYIAERSGKFSAQLKFKYTDQSESKHLDLSFNPIHSFLIKDKMVSKSKGLTLVWDGGALEEGESLLLLFSDQTNKAASTTLKGPSRKSEILLPGNFLKDLQPGKGNLFLVRKQSGEINDDLTNYKYLLEYYTSPLAIKISG